MWSTEYLISLDNFNFNCIFFNNLKKKKYFFELKWA